MSQSSLLTQIRAPFIRLQVRGTLGNTPKGLKTRNKSNQLSDRETKGSKALCCEIGQVWILFFLPGW